MKGSAILTKLLIPAFASCSDSTINIVWSWYVKYPTIDPSTEQAKAKSFIPILWSFSYLHARQIKLIFVAIEKF